MTGTFLLLILLRVTPGALGFQRLPTAWLDQQTITVATANFRVTSPYPNTTWFYRDDPTPRTGNLMVVAATPGHEALTLTVFRFATTVDKDKAASFVRHVNEGTPSGWKLLAGTLEDASLTVKCSRFTSTFQLPDGSIRHQHGYLLTDNEHTYMLQEATPSPTESAAFRAFAASFQFVRPPTPPSQPMSSVSIIVLVALAAFVLGSIIYIPRM